MPQVISKRAFDFGGQPGQPTFNLKASNLPQSIPDWITSDPLFSIAVSDGNLSVWNAPIEEVTVSALPSKQKAEAA
jgi:hypothetical protein